MALSTSRLSAAESLTSSALPVTLRNDRYRFSRNNYVVDLFENKNHC